MKPSLSFWSGALAFAMAGLVPGWAHAQDPASAPLPTLPAPDDGAAPAPSRATTKTDTPIVTAGTVHTNRVDTVVVAEPGSSVTVLGVGSGSSDGNGEHREYAPDPGRKAAIIASPIVFGVGGAVAGIAYLTARGQTTCTPTYGAGYTVTGSTCTHGDVVPPLVLYDVVVGAVPSTPRWVVGDIGGALLYTGLRGGSLLVASVIDWGNGSNNWVGPFTLGFLLPVTLGIVDLATTPHREDLEPAHKSPNEQARLLRPRITGISPVALTDSERRVNGAVLDLSASF
jgi:hypothetical protein